MILTSRQYFHTSIQEETMEQCTDPITNSLKLIGGKWKICDKDSINTSFPSFLKIVKKISNK